MSEYSSFVNPMDVYTSVVMAAIVRIIAFGALLVGSFGVVVCSSVGCRKDFDWKGKWVGRRDIGVVPGTPPEIENSVRHVTLEVKQNWEYELHVSGIPSNGVFHPAGKEATLEPVNKLSRPVGTAPPVKLTANDDGTVTMESPDALDSGFILLRRESQPAG
jgi:hypothetical protein